MIYAVQLGKDDCGFKKQSNLIELKISEQNSKSYFEVFFQTPVKRRRAVPWVFLHDFETSSVPTSAPWWTKQRILKNSSG
jgi:hypothetical protein